jgi:hypothetical protein
MIVLDDFVHPERTRYAFRGQTALLLMVLGPLSRPDRVSINDI